MLHRHSLSAIRQSEPKYHCHCNIVVALISPRRSFALLMLPIEIHVRRSVVGRSHLAPPALWFGRWMTVEELAEEVMAPRLHMASFALQLENLQDDPFAPGR